MRFIRFVVHNWPLKIGAVALSTLLYGGLVLSQTTQDFKGSVPIEAVNQAPDVIILSNLGAVSEIRYVAPADLGLRVDSGTFKATVDLAHVDPNGDRVTIKVVVTAIDPRIQVLSYEPLSIGLTLDRVTSRTVPIRAVLGPIPSGLRVGEPVVDLPSATVKGPASIVAKVAEVQARVSVDASGIDVNRQVDLLAVDVAGEPLAPIDVDPVSVLVRVAVFTDLRTRTVPIGPVVVGTPAAGFEVASVSVDPVVVQVQGDANDLAGLDLADTAPISVTGLSSDLTATVPLALPSGVQALGAGTVKVTVRLREVTSTRTFDAGLILVGARSDRQYTLSVNQVLVTIGGSVVDLDRLTGANLVLDLNVSGLDDGAHTVVPTANLTTGLTLLGLSPGSIVVTITTPAPSPS